MRAQPGAEGGKKPLGKDDHRQRRASEPQDRRLAGGHTVTSCFVTTGTARESMEATTLRSMIRMIAVRTGPDQVSRARSVLPAKS